MMQNLIDKIFTHYNFSKLLEDGTVSLYGKSATDGENEYFILDYFNKDSFIENENVIESAFHLFEKGKLIKSNVEKNTSLIICVKIDKIQEDIPDLKNKILKIEEDNFWFKKYILIYSEASITALQGLDIPLEYLKSRLLDSERFNRYKTDLFYDEEYFLVVQLYLKIPFISVPFQTEDNFKSIDTLMFERLSTTELAYYGKLKEERESIDTIDWERINELIQNPASSDDLIEETLRKLTPNV